MIGEGIKGRKWRGPTRLLLLDERYAKKGMDEMPEAVKVALTLCELISVLICSNFVCLLLLCVRIMS